MQTATQALRFEISLSSWQIFPLQEEHDFFWFVLKQGTVHAHAHNAVSETRLSDGAVLGVVGKTRMEGKLIF